MDNNLPNQHQSSTPPFLLANTMVNENDTNNSEEQVNEKSKELLQMLKDQSTYDSDLISIINYLPIAKQLFADVLAALTKNPYSIYLIFYKEDVDKFDSYAVQLKQLLSKIPGKKAMAFSADALSKEAVHSLLTLNPDIQSLHIQANEYTNEILDSVKEFIKRYVNNKTSIQNLLFEYIDFESANFFSDFLSTYHSLASLTIEYCTLGKKQVGVIGSFLEKNINLTKLAITLSSLEDEHVTMLAQALKQNTKLTKLNLSWNHLSNLAAKTLAEVFEQNPKTGLIKINLSYNPIGAGVFNYITTILEQEDKLKRLDISFNPKPCNASVILAKKLLGRQTPFTIKLKIHNDNDDESCHVDFETCLLWLNIIANNPFFRIGVNAKGLSKKADEPHTKKLLKLFAEYQQFNAQIRQCLKVRFFTIAHFNELHKLLIAKENLATTGLVTVAAYRCSVPSLLDLVKAWVYERLIEQNDTQQSIMQLDDLPEELQQSLQLETPGLCKFRLFAERAVGERTIWDSKKKCEQRVIYISKDEKQRRLSLTEARWARLFANKLVPIGGELSPTIKRQNISENL